MEYILRAGNKIVVSNHTVPKMLGNSSAISSLSGGGGGGTDKIFMKLIYVQHKPKLCNASGENTETPKWI